ncbi:MAG: rRNA maturation RNase YbeY [bacterium]
MKTQNNTNNTIYFHFHEINIFPFPESLFRKWILFLIHNEQKILGDINVIFVSDQYLYEMNVSYLKHDYLTDVITFNYGNSENNIVSGDIFISIDRISENSQINRLPFLNELLRIIFHGVLHLIGYDDKNNDDKHIMTAKEDYYLQKCKF